MTITHGISSVVVKRARHGWWFRTGETYEVTLSPHMATIDGVYACCNCTECVAERSGKRLEKVYIVTSGDKRGSIIPVECCE